jgi:RNA polymerase sigma-70 factor (ECF subfamily)
VAGDGAHFERLSDDALMDLVKRGDPRAFDVLARRHLPAVASQARFACGTDLADDATQAALVSLWQHRGKYEPGRGTPRSWLLTMVRHRGIDQLRSRAVRQRLSVSGDPEPWIELAGPIAEPAHAHVLRAESSETVRRLVATLPPAQREVIELAYFDGFTQQQIADRMGVPLGTVKGRLRLGLDKLREAWDVPDSHAPGATAPDQALLAA